MIQQQWVQCTSCNNTWNIAGYWKSACPQCGVACSVRKPRPMEPRTQKAKGIMSLMGAGLGEAVQIQRLLQSPEDISIVKSSGYPFFARPCPKTPRHGFVDSRVVNSPEELKQVIKETFAADPEGEVVLMPFMAAELNYVWVPSFLTIGAGHDGATAGKNTIRIPLSGGNPFDPAFLENAGIGEGQWPFVEAVSLHGGASYLTQLRAGPALGRGGDFVPRTTVVEKVLRPEGMDLLKWEELIDSFDGQPGVVVENLGGSPADHYSIHARENKVPIPVIVTRPVQVGETLEEIPRVPLDPESVLEGLALGDEISLSYDAYECRAAVTLLLAALHGIPNAEGKDGRWLGLGTAFLLRLGTTAVKGEARHIRHVDGQMPDRTTVYRRTLPYSLNRQRASLPALAHVLRYGKFSGTGIGGIKWAQCALATAKLFDAVGELARKRDQESLSSLIRMVNIVVNQAHNGGWWLNKFAQQNAFDNIQNGKFLELFQSGSFLHRCGSLEADPEMVARKVNRWAGWKEIRLIPPPMEHVGMSAVPGLGGVVFDFKDRILKSKYHRSITIDQTKLVDFFLRAAKGAIYAERTDKGLVISLKRPYQDPEVIFEEEELDVQQTPAVK
jgi:hypothetical protein